MKFKTDFVTNSSSTSYVVYIPKNFNVSPQEIRDYAETQFDENIFEESEIIQQNDMIEDVLRNLEDVKNGNCVYEADGFDPKDSLSFNFISYICSKNGFKLASEDIGGGGGMSVIIGITFDKIQEIEDKWLQR